MPRLDRARLQRCTFPTRLEVQTRVDDLDGNGHVNNAAIAVILQEARARLHIDGGIRNSLVGRRLMVAGLTIEFAAELHHPDPIEVSSGILSVGRSSYVLGQVARQAGRDGVYCEAAMVVADANGPATIAGPLRAALERMLMSDRRPPGAALR